MLARLLAQGIDAVATAYSPIGIRVRGKPSLQGVDVYDEGLVEVQDEGSQLLALATGAKRGEMVVDFCAGAGGKTLALGAQMRNTGRLYAFDTSGHRLAAMKPRIRPGRARQRAPGADRPRARRAGSSGWPARSTGCWSMRRAPASARCAGTPT